MISTETLAKSKIVSLAELQMGACANSTGHLDRSLLASAGDESNR